MAMALRGVAENSEGKGLSVSRGWLGEKQIGPAKVIKVIGISYRKNRDTNIMINFCPWCGNRIRFDQEA